MKDTINFRLATQQDIQAIVEMLLDDAIGATREKLTLPLSDKYREAFDKISRDPNQELTVAEMNGELVGTFHLSFIQYLTHEGSLRAQIEAVRTHSAYRGKGIGTKMFQYAIERARQRHCKIIQLTTDKRRADAKKFYEALGFKATHEGMKLHL
jgi:GNAT superfamily N-acetyltransferase